MTKIITMLSFFICSLITAQTNFEQGMGKALGLWGDGKTDEASAMFERIASAEKNSWLPNYYIALINTTSAFQTQDKVKIVALLTKAQSALDVETVKNPLNAELIVMQAMIHTAYLASDPMTYGMTLPAKVNELYSKAAALAPQNPRVVFCRAEFEIGGAKWTGADVKALCKEIEGSMDLFAKFKPETPFHPNWGLERAQEAMKNCK